MLALTIAGLAVQTVGAFIMFQWNPYPADPATLLGGPAENFGGPSDPPTRRKVHVMKIGFGLVALGGVLQILAAVL